MADISKLKEELGRLTVLEVAGLVKDLEEEWGVSAAPAAGMMMAGPAAPAEAAEEKTDFDVVLESFGENKIAVIKEVRSCVPGLGLADAKKLVEGAPSTLREAAPKDEADAIKKKLEEAGAKVTLK
ncbi:MAG: large subunit ribosomal protein L7/L12 [Verrucomicrobiales bacterium]|jgi:large subunit ribosomal protein L7/L12